MADPTPPPTEGPSASADPPVAPPGPRIPTPEEASTYRPAADLFVALLDLVSEAALGRPLHPRWALSAGGLARGELDMVQVDLPALHVAGLLVDHFVVRAERVRIRPGLPPVLVAEPVALEVVVSQDNVDRWTRELRMPFRFRLTDEGVVTTAGIGGFRVTEVLTTPDISGGLLRLRPRRASLLGVPTTLVRFLRGYLPLPPLPRDAHIDSVEPAEGTLTLVIGIDRFEQPLTADVRKALRRIVRLPLPFLR